MISKKDIKNIKVFSHFACPSCYIGKGVINKLQEEINFDLTWYPTEIAKNVPREGMSLITFFNQKDMDADKRYREVKELGSKFGLIINQPTLKVNTLSALVLGEYAKKNGKYDEYSELVYKFHYEDDKNIGDEDVLKEILEKVGLDAKEGLNKIRDNTYEDRFKSYEEIIKANDITKTPTFIINNEIIVVGELDMIHLLWGEK